MRIYYLCNLIDHEVRNVFRKALLLTKMRLAKLTKLVAKLGPLPKVSVPRQRSQSSKYKTKKTHLDACKESNRELKITKP